MWIEITNSAGGIHLINDRCIAQVDMLRDKPRITLTTSANIMPMESIQQLKQVLKPVKVGATKQAVKRKG